MLTAAGNTHSTSKSPAAAARKQRSSQSAASPKEVSHRAAEVDAETFTGTNVINKNMEIVQKKHPHATLQKKSGKLQQGNNNAAQNNPINALNKILKQAGNRAENAISNTFKGVGKKPAHAAKKNKGKAKTTQGQGGSIPQPRGGGSNRKVTTLQPNPDYSDIEEDENGNPVVLNEADIPEEHDTDPKSANQSSSADDHLEDFPPYGGDYSGVDEGPVSYPDENPAPSSKRNNKKNKGGNKKNKGKKGGKKAITNKKKRKNKKQGLLDPGKE